MKQGSAIQVSLAEKVVLVTGGARGIGLATVQLALQCGGRVVYCDLSPAADNYEPEQPAGVIRLEGDVSSEQDCERLVAETLSRCGRLDVLVNNAGVLELSRSTVKQEMADWQKIIDVNLRGTFAMSRAAARAMTSQGIHGSIVNICSIAGLTGFRASNAYGVSKAAVAMLTKTLSVDLAPHRIRVNAVAPGFVNTAMTVNLRDATKIERDEFVQRIPLGRFGEADEIARAVVFLASDCASYITGAVLPVDGGWLAFGGPGSM